MSNESKTMERLPDPLLVAIATYYVHKLQAHLSEKPWDKQADLDMVEDVCAKQTRLSYVCSSVGAFEFCDNPTPVRHYFIHEGTFPLAEVTTRTDRFPCGCSVDTNRIGHVTEITTCGAEHGKTLGAIDDGTPYPLDNAANRLKVACSG